MTSLITKKKTLKSFHKTKEIEIVSRRETETVLFVVFSYKDTNWIGSGPHPVTAFNLN